MNNTVWKNAFEKAHSIYSPESPIKSGVGEFSCQQNDGEASGFASVSLNNGDKIKDIEKKSSCIAFGSKDPNSQEAISLLSEDEKAIVSGFTYLGMFILYDELKTEEKPFYEGQKIIAKSKNGVSFEFTVKKDFVKTVPQEQDADYNYHFIQTVEPENEEFLKEIQNSFGIDAIYFRKDRMFSKNISSGYFSLSEGKETSAVGDFSHSEGNKTISLDKASHAEGSETISVGKESHAEGHKTKSGAWVKRSTYEKVFEKPSNESLENGEFMVIGDASHSEGINTISAGSGSHAEGYNTIATCEYSHAEGQYNVYTDSMIHMVGVGTSNTERKNAYTITKDGKNYILGLGGYNGTQDSLGHNGDPVKDLVSVINSKIDLSEKIWKNDENTDIAPPLKGQFYGSSIENIYKGEKFNLIENIDIASPWESGKRIKYIENSAIGEYSHAEGCQTTASGFGAHAEGGSKSDLGNPSSRTTASGFFSHAEGNCTEASGDWGAHTEGTVTKASGSASHAEGKGTISEGDNSHAEGLNSKTEIHANGSHAEGEKTITISDSSHAEGCETRTGAWKNNKTEEITTTTPKSDQIMNGEYSLIGRYSHTEGFRTFTLGNNSHAEGKYNVSNETMIHMVGIGASNSERKNAHTITNDGKHYMANLKNLAGDKTYLGTEEVLPEGLDLVSVILELQNKVKELERIINENHPKQA